MIQKAIGKFIIKIIIRMVSMQSGVSSMRSPTTWWWKITPNGKWTQLNSWTLCRNIRLLQMRKRWKSFRKYLRIPKTMWPWFRIPVTQADKKSTASPTTATSCWVYMISVWNRNTALSTVMPMRLWVIRLLPWLTWWECCLAWLRMMWSKKRVRWGRRCWSIRLSIQIRVMVVTWIDI